MIELRQPTDNDAEFLVECGEDEHLRALVERLGTDIWNPWVAFMIYLNDRPIGFCTLTSIDEDERSAEFGIWIKDEKFRGRGYGFLATRQFLKACADALGLKSVYIRTEETNTQAVRSAKHFGFVDGEIKNGIVTMTLDVNEMRRRWWNGGISITC